MKKRYVLLAHLMIAGSCFAGPGSMAILQIRDLSKATDQVAQLAEKLQLPMPPGIIQGQIGMLAMNPSLAGVDTAQPITIYVGKLSSEPGDTPDTVIRFSVTGDGADYLAAVKMMAPVHEEVSPGVNKFVMGDPADATAPVFFAIIKENQALGGQSLEAIKALSGDLTDNEKRVLAALPGEVSVSINVVAINELMAAQVKQQKEMIAMYKEQMEAQGMDTTEMFASDPTAGLDSMNTMISAILNQLDLLVLNVDLSGNITIRTHAQPTPNSTLATILEETVPPSTIISGYTGENALFSGYGTMAGVDRVLEPYAEWVTSMYKQMGPPMDSFADSYKTMILGMKGVYSGGFNLVVNPPLPDAPLQLAGLYEIADKAKAKQSMQAMMKMQEEQGNAMTNLPYSVSVSSAGEEPYRDVEIETFTISYDFSDESIDEAMPESISQLFNNMKYSVAYMDNYLGYSFGSLENMHALIDYALGEEPPAPHRPGFEDVTGEAIGYWNLDVARMIAGVTSLLPPELSGSLESVQGIEASLRGLSVKELDGISSMIRLTEADLQGLMQIGMSLAPKGNAGFAPPPDEGMMIPEEEMEMEEEVEATPEM